MAWYTYTSNGVLLQVSDFDLQPPDGGVMGRNNLTKAAIDSEYTWDPVTKDFFPRNMSVITKLEFLLRFSVTERVAIRELAKTNPVVFDAMELLNIAEFVSLSDITTSNLVMYLYSLNVYTYDRAVEILTY